MQQGFCSPCFVLEAADVLPDAWAQGTHVGTKDPSCRFQGQNTPAMNATFSHKGPQAQAGRGKIYHDSAASFVSLF